jgi:nucleotide-binding universal stress UspA family protein
MIVTMAIITTMAMPPMLRWSLARLAIGKEEGERLEKEEIDAKGFVSRFERLLIAADNGANGRLATRLAGFIAGQRGLPITVLHLPEKRASRSDTQSEGVKEELEAVATAGAKEGHRAAIEEGGESRPDRVDVSSRVEKEDVDSVVAREGAKGYDLLFVGVEEMRNPDGTFSANVDRAAQGFDGPLALTIADSHADAPAAEGFNILVPVNGTEPSRRGAEVAFALSRASASQITALHVAQRVAGTSDRPPRGRSKRKAETALMEDITALARRYGHREIRTAVRMQDAPDAAIIAEARRIGADLIVIGAGRRTGETLNLGQTVASVLAQWDGAIVLVAT